jgi:hypothetical protein
MMRFAMLCLMLGLLGCGQAREEKTQQAMRRDVRTSSSAGKPAPEKPSRSSAAATAYHNEPPARRPRGRISPTLQREVDAFLKEPPLKVTASDLAKAYQNEAVGDKEFKGRKVWLTGYVLRASRGVLGAPYVELEPGKGQSGAIRCFFEKGRSHSVEELQESQEVTIEGHVSAKTGPDVRLDGCRTLTPAEVQSIIEAARDQ